VLKLPAQTNPEEAVTNIWHRLEPVVRKDMYVLTRDVTAFIQHARFRILLHPVVGSEAIPPQLLKAAPVDVVDFSSYPLFKIVNNKFNFVLYQLLRFPAEKFFIYSSFKDSSVDKLAGPLRNIQGSIFHPEEKKGDVKLVAKPVAVNFYPGVITGETTAQDRKGFVDAYNRDEKDQNGIRILIGTRAANTGISLKLTSRVIIYESTWNEASISQAIDRAVRMDSHQRAPGAPKPIVIVERLLHKRPDNYQEIIQATVNESFWDRVRHEQRSIPAPRFARLVQQFQEGMTVLRGENCLLFEGKEDEKQLREGDPAGISAKMVKAIETSLFKDDPRAKANFLREIQGRPCGVRNLSGDELLLAIANAKQPALDSRYKTLRSIDYESPTCESLSLGHRIDNKSKTGRWPYTPARHYQVPHRGTGLEELVSTMRSKGKRRYGELGSSESNKRQRRR
jgi:hypothetical protein